jgi:hypothetical protein
MNKLWWFATAVCLLVGGLIVYDNSTRVVQPPPQPPEKKLVLPPTPKAQLPQITNRTPGHLDYKDIILQLDKWQKEAPDFVDRGTYGQSAKNQPLHYIRITNKVAVNIAPRKVVLITACIHGNEPLATSTVMAFIGNMLADYESNADVKNLLDNRDIYFVPVVSPDSFPSSRFVDGVDPNRNFPTLKNPNLKSSPSVQGLRELVLKIKPNAVISGHTWGRVFLFPYGDDMKNCPDYDSYKTLTGKMGQMCGYRHMRACDMYGGNGGLNNPPPKNVHDQGHDFSMIPIYGSEVDWYYRQGAFAIVMEMGNHQRVPSMEDTRVEFEMTYRAVLTFINEAPMVELKLR